MTRPRPAKVRVYIDADLLGLAEVLCRLRPDFTRPGDLGAEINKRLRPPCPVVSPGAPDEEWLPVVGEHGWLAVTRDRWIQDKVHELEAVRDNDVRMINISGLDAADKWSQLEVFMTRWREIEALIDEPGPFIRQVTRRGKLVPIDLSEDALQRRRQERRRH